MYDAIVDEVVFIASASEGAISIEWLMDQPIIVRKRYRKQFEEVVKERQKRLEQAKSR